MKTKRILYLYTGDHPLHRKFAETITKKILPFSKKIPKNYDVYFVEGEYSRIIALKKLGKINKKAKIIILFSDPRLFYLNSQKKYDSRKNMIVKNNWLKKIIAERLLRKIDGVICIGNFEKDLFRKINKNVPVMVADPFIDNKLYSKLKKIKPALTGKKIIFIANGPDYYYKGLDILIKIFREIKKIFSKSELHIIGKWKIKKEWMEKDIFFEGYKKNVSEYYKKSSLYLHLARGEAFGLVVLEAMLAGIPCIVSDITGAKEVIAKVDKKFIVPLNHKKIIKIIKYYFNLRQNEKNKLSKKFKKIAGGYEEKEKLKKFKEQFLKFLGDIYKNEP